MAAGRRGFTLIELLVVIAIIAILAAILFPVFSKARENARKATCQNNLKQMAMACSQYSQDYDEMLPGGRASDSGGCGDESKAFWMHVVFPYIGSKDVFKCPSMTSQSGGTCAKFYPWARALNIGTNYGINCNAFRSPGNPMSQILRPSELMYIGPANAGGGWFRIIKTNPNTNCGADVHSHYRARHSGGINVAYVDGHVKWLSIEKAFAPTTTEQNNYLPWNNKEVYMPGW